MRIVVDWDLCQGHANCTSEAPDVFHVDDGGKLHILIEEPDEALHPKVELAARYCPSGALRIRD